MKRYFIYYANGLFETTEKININHMHMIDVGLIKIIVDSKENNAIISNGTGSYKEVKIPEIEGLN